MKELSTGIWVRLSTWWVRKVLRHSKAASAIIGILSMLILWYSIQNSRFNMDLSGMISPELSFRQRELKFNQSFPNLTNTIVIVIEADRAEAALSARDRLAKALYGEPEFFRNIYRPGGGDFFYRNGLLYLSLDELEDFSDNMAAMQPFLSVMSGDPGLPGFFSLLQQLFEQSGQELMQDRRIQLLFRELSERFIAVRSRNPMPWTRIMLGEKEAASQRRQFIILQPVESNSAFSEGERAISEVRRIIRDLGLGRDPGLRVRITGDLALNEENLEVVRNSVGAATIASVLLVSLLLFIGLHRSGRLVFASLATLFIGLIWTMGFAIAFIGSLNMISITFAVLFIGLGIDYSIQFCLRYRELAAAGPGLVESITLTANGTGRGLLFSCVATAIGFYSFLPTAYAGVAELGLISGTGMFIAFFLNLTLLPALLKIIPHSRNARPRGFALKEMLTIPYRYPRTIGITALVIGLGAAAFVPKLRFDYNPLNLYDPQSEAVATIRDLFKDPRATPWTISVLAGTKQEAALLSEKLRALPETGMAITIFDYIPGDQARKLQIISDIQLFMLFPDRVGIRRASCEQNSAALSALERSVRTAAQSSFRDPALDRLAEAIRHFSTLRNEPETFCAGFQILEQNLLSDLPGLFGRLSLSLNARPITLRDLPRDLIDQYVSHDGRYRIQVFPREDITNPDLLSGFVHAVYTVAPEATDSPVSIYESGRAIITSFRNATLFALAAIIIFLLVMIKRIRTIILILVPLTIALLLTAAISVLLAIPLNFANVIVLPLLLGLGVHNGILFAVRYRTEPPPDGNMLFTSTARAMLFSALTTMASTGSLSFSAHRGISSIGIFLTAAFVFLIFSTLILTPSLFELFGNNHKSRPKQDSYF